MLVDQLLYLSFHGRDLRGRAARLGGGPRPRDRISCACRLEVVGGAVVLDVPVVVRHQAHGVALDEARALTLSGALSGLADRVTDREWIAAVDRHRRDAVARGPVGQPGERHRLRDRCHLRPAVVLAHEHDGKASSRSEGDPLVERPLVDGAVTEGDDGDPSGPEGHACEGAPRCNRNAGADDRVLADEPEPGCHHVRRAGTTAVDSGRAMEALGEKRVDSDAALERPPVTAIRGNDAIVARRVAAIAPTGIASWPAQKCSEPAIAGGVEVLSSRQRSSNRRMISIRR